MTEAAIQAFFDDDDEGEPTAMFARVKISIAMHTEMQALATKDGLGPHFESTESLSRLLSEVEISEILQKPNVYFDDAPISVIEEAEPKDEGNENDLVAGLVIGGAVSLACIVTMLFRIRQRRRDRKADDEGE